MKFLDNNSKSLQRLSASNCIDAITDKSVEKLANIESVDLQFLDISYAKLLTDEGLNHFKGKTFPLTHLCVNGLTQVTGMGLFHPIMAGKDSLLVYQGALMDQEDLKIAEFGKALGVCFNLESLDVGGCKHITDEFFNHLTSGSFTNEEG